MYGLLLAVLVGLVVVGGRYESPGIEVIAAADKPVVCKPLTFECVAVADHSVCVNGAVSLGDCVGFLVVRRSRINIEGIHLAGPHGSGRLQTAVTGLREWLFARKDINIGPNPFHDAVSGRLSIVSDLYTDRVFRAFDGRDGINQNVGAQFKLGMIAHKLVRLSIGLGAFVSGAGRIFGMSSCLASEISGPTRGASSNSREDKGAYQKDQTSRVYPALNARVFRDAPLLTQIGVILVFGGVANGAIGFFVYRIARREMSDRALVALLLFGCMACTAVTLPIFFLIL